MRIPYGTGDSIGAPFGTPAAFRGAVTDAPDAEGVTAAAMTIPSPTAAFPDLGDEFATEPAENGVPGFPVAQVARSGLQYIDGLLAGKKWDSHIIYYSDPDSVSDYQAGYPAGPLTGFNRLSAGQMAAVHDALQGYLSGKPGYQAYSVEGFTNLGITYFDGGTGYATLRFGNNTDANTAYAYYPDTTVTAGDVWFGKSGVKPTQGNYDYTTVLHEIGHALGLKHGHETWGYGALPFETDSMEYSVMTYKSYVGPALGYYTNEEWGYAQTFMMYDIAALQHMYGADFDANSGNTVYSWNPTTGASYVNGALAIAPGGNRIFQTIWDGNGNDTYDLSNYSTNLSINLNPGYHSTFSTAQLADLDILGNHKARGNVFNALQYNGDARSLIENARGGSGKDDILGNAANNRLFGNDGDDDLTGFAGNDSLYGGGGKDWLDGHIGADAMYGGDQDDIYYVDNLGDLCGESTVSRTIGGVDLVFAYVSHTLGYGLDNLTLLSGADINGHGNELANNIDGGIGRNELDGYAGNDLLRGNGGNDVLSGGDGKDRLVGGAGADLLFGGKGADVFDFDKVGDSAPGARDVCRAGNGAVAFEGAGISGGDLIDLKGIDANTILAGNQAFVFGGTGIGRVSVVNVGTDSLVRCNVDKDAPFEFELLLEDGGVLASAYKALDFIL